jgi:serine/threonine protein kinase
VGERVLALSDNARWPFCGRVAASTVCYLNRDVCDGHSPGYDLSSMSLEDSLVLGRYRVLWQVDQKKLLRTYIARDEQREGIDNPVLIRQFLHDLGDVGGAPVSSLFDELTALKQLRHPGVVPLLDYGTVEENLVTAYTHQPGVDLLTLCELLGRRQQVFPAHLAVHLVRSLLLSLHECHTRPKRSFVHGRITLNSIHLPGVGQPQIADFGLATLEDAAAEAESQLGFFQTRMSYAAPEVTRGGPATPRGDTYSLALLLYRLLSGSNPFRGRSIPETLQRVLQLEPAPLHMPAWEHCAIANTILMRALSKDPAQRYASCLELREAFSTLCAVNEETCAAELSNLVRSNSSADWGQIARLTRAVKKARSSRSVSGAEQGTGSALRESTAPAFVSGLLTDQPRSATEHTIRDQQQQLQARQRRRRQRQWLMVPTVLIPAAAIIFGLFLGRLGASGARVAASSLENESAQLVNGSVSDLRARLQGCGTTGEFDGGESKLELEFGSAGSLSEVRLSPRNMVNTRLGACLLQTAWDAKVTAPGALSLVIPLSSN